MGQAAGERHALVEVWREPLLEPVGVVTLADGRADADSALDVDQLGQPVGLAQSRR